MLCYYDMHKCIPFQVQALKSGVVTILLQEGKLVAFISKAVTTVEQPILKTATCLYFDAEHFHMYIFGCRFTMESDQKLFKQVHFKNLAGVLECLQCMVLHLQGYNITITCHSGKEMLLADTLLFYDPWSRNAVVLDVAIHQTQLSTKIEVTF